ncbi:periplasmic heavy metal sensor [Hyphobacterium sp.]|uniref:periplasmic heavy metal sensor n=1 Tax=Hyphobacterium sp. TaxID=2004662 RepID=UPI003B5280CD
MNRALPWIIALLISLTANGVMTGIVLHRVAGSPHVSDVVRHEHRHPPRDPSDAARTGGFNVRAFLRSLPEEQQQIARQRFASERVGFRELMLAAQNAQQDAEAALRADPYDPQAAAEALGELRARRFEIEAAMEAIVLELVADLPPEERMNALAAGRRRPGGFGRRGDRRPSPRDRF